MQRVGVSIMIIGTKIVN